MEATTPPAEIRLVSSDAVAHVSPLVSAHLVPEHTYQQDTSLTASSISNEQVYVHPGPGSLDADGTRGVQAQNYGSLGSGNVQGLESIDHRLATHQGDDLPVSTSQGNPCYGDSNAPTNVTSAIRPLKQNPSPETSTSQPSTKEFSGGPLVENLLGNRLDHSVLSLSPSAASPTYQDTRTCTSVPISRSRNGASLPSPPEGDPGGRGVREASGLPLPSPEEEKSSPSQEEARAWQGLPDPSSDDIPNSIGLHLRETSNFFHDQETSRDDASSKEEHDAPDSHAADSDIELLDADDLAQTVSEADTDDEGIEEPLHGSVDDANDSGRPRLRFADSFPPAPYNHLHTEDEGYAIEIDDDSRSNGFIESSQIGDNGDTAEADDDPNHEEEEIVETSDEEDNDISNDLARRFACSKLDSDAESGGFESDADAGSIAVAFRGGQQNFSPFSDEEDSSDDSIYQEDSDEEMEEEEAGYLSGSLASDDEPMGHGPSSMSNSPLSQTRFSKKSANTIHRVPCLRLKITDLVLYRSGGLNLTRRWTGIEMRDIPRLDSPVITIEVSQNLCEKPLLMRVVRFQPRDGDITARYWTDCLLGKETLKKKELAIYCLDSIYNTAEEVRKYTIDNALPAFIHTIRGGCESEPENESIIRTYLTALDRYLNLHTLQRSDKKLSWEDEKEVGIFGNLFILWCAIQHTVGSLYIQGNETLGMLPETEDESYPLYGKVSVPRMVVAQFDNLNYNEVLERYKEKLLKDIDWLFGQDKNRWWFTIYLLRYSIPAFVESLHESCNNILTHWHYYNCNKWPGRKSTDDKRSAHFESLEPEYADLIRQTRKNPEVKKHLSYWKQYKEDNGKVENLTLKEYAGSTSYTGRQDKFDWDHSLYWVAQMFEKDWYSHPTYQREAHSRWCRR
ncbi:hypothetical protein FSARC_3929 [Fusarium sarcochroum]|uniref:Uncharacterized protein n=1 Tax=Fusarium sarcochroum TaxID=1208366 RepID=A0A8H4U2Y4_9HYPO|nr:hypothetical protein FSARC_3929 [Fusarium sarcochroum]